MHQHFLNQDFISQNKLQRLTVWGMRPKDHYQIVYFLHIL